MRSRTPTVAWRERQQLADLFEQVGPHEPTLCEGWDTGDLLNHLLVRERRFDAIAGDYIRRLRPWMKRVARKYKGLPWDRQVAMLRQGPQWFNPVRLTFVDAAFNTGEYFIHHEDVRRGRPGWSPRELDPETTKALVGQLTGVSAKYVLRKIPVGVVITLPDGTTQQVKDGEPSITLAGPPAEQVLWVSGRRACNVEVTGSDEALRKLDEQVPDTSDPA
jgi:uncharacterized protein (TIGR03085 family)